MWISVESHDRRCAKQDGAQRKDAAAAADIQKRLAVGMIKAEQTPQGRGGGGDTLFVDTG
jgi:hypothetical protein